MEGRRFKIVFKLLVSSLLGLAASQALASPITLDFDDIDADKGSVSDQGYAGFQWDDRWALGSTDMSTAYQDVAGSGTQFLYNEGLVAELTVGRDTPFDFLGATFGAPANSSRAYWVNVAAFDADGEVGQTGYHLFFENSFRMDTLFQSVTKLVMTSHGGIFTMDDFTYRNIEAKVNEAGGLILLGIGLFGLWAARRRTQP